MNRRIESITEIDLQAYIDDELAANRRMEVQAYLRCHEAEAAQIMSDMRTRDLLRLAVAESSLPPSGATVDAAVRLERGLWRDRMVQPAAAAGGFLCAYAEFSGRVEPYQRRMRALLASELPGEPAPEAGAQRLARPSRQPELRRSDSYRGRPATPGRNSRVSGTRQNVASAM